MSVQRLINTFVRGKNNKVVIWQRPNLPILGWFACTIAAHLIHGQRWHTGFSSLATALLSVWAYLEITQGASYFRRFLGLLVATAIVAHYFS